MTNSKHAAAVRQGRHPAGGFHCRAEGG